MTRDAGRFKYSDPHGNEEALKTGGIFLELFVFSSKYAYLSLYGNSGTRMEPVKYNELSFFYDCVDSGRSNLASKALNVTRDIQRERTYKCLTAAM